VLPLGSQVAGVAYSR